MGQIIDRLSTSSKGLLTEIKRGQTGYGILVENDGFITPDKENLKTIKEALSGEKGWHIDVPFKVAAVFQKFGIQNANGRIYPEGVLRKQVEVYQKLINERLSYGELNHPETSTIDGDRISHIITKLSWDKSTLVGELELNLSPAYINEGIICTRGDQAANLILNGYKIGVSSRGIGSVSQSMGKTIVNDDFEIVCWDIVTSPSTPGAYMDMDKKNLQQYVENRQRKLDHHSALMEKLDRTLDILKG